MSPLLVGACKKCETQVKLDIGDKSIAEVVEGLGKWESFHCPGHHVELSSPVPHYWDIETWKLEEGAAPTEEEFVAELTAKYKKIYNTKELQEDHEVLGFSMGCCIARPKAGGEKCFFDYMHSPEGVRYYYQL